MGDAAEALARMRASLAEALARRRVSLGFVIGALVLWLARPSMRTLAVGVPLALLGEGLRIWAAGHLNKSREITSSGPYRWLAHPLYVGSSLMGIGLAIAAGSVVVAALIAIYLGTTLTAAIKSEEAFLRGAFGDRYDQYRRGAGADPGEALRRFAVSRALANREHRAIAGLAVAIMLLMLKAAR